ncbi:hypothetical protein G8761_06905 [Bacillus sp. C11]|nr:hypothetical protein [Neobacillus terrae]
MGPGGMRPRMMGGSPAGRMGPSPGMQAFNTSPMMGQMGQMGQSRQMMSGMGQMSRQGGGLLSKILGKGNQARTMGGIAAAGRQAGAGGGGILQTLSNPGAINGFLNNTQQILKTAQSIGPMVQQYGPLVKNLPSMWKLYRGLKTAMADSGKSETKKESVKESSTVQAESSVESSSVQISSSSPSKKNYTKKKKETAGTNITKTKGSSTPRLYV